MDSRERDELTPKTREPESERKPRTRFSRRAVIKTAGIATPALLFGGLAACGDDDDDSPTTAPGQTPQGSQTQTSQPTAAPKRIENVAVGITEEPPSFDVHRAFGGVYMHFMTNVFEGLLGRDTKNQIVPKLAETYTVSPDGKMYEFKLRKNVKFHNGDPFTAADVEFSFNRNRNPDIQPRQTLMKRWERIEVVDEYTVRYYLTQADPTFIGYISSQYYMNIVPKAYLETVGDEGFEKKPVGTGKYSFVRRVVKEFWELEAFDEHWGGAAAAKKVRFNVIPEPSTLSAALQSGSIDLVAGIAPQFSSSFDGGQFKLIRNPASNTIDVRINTLLENSKDGGGPNPWRDVRVRKAMDLALDRDAIINKLLNGFGEQITGLFPDDPGHPNDLKPYPYDPAQAKALLDQAGYGDGLDATFWGLLGQRVPNAAQVGEAMAGYFSAIGMKTSVRNVEYADWLARVTPGQSRGKDIELWPFGLGITYIGGQFHPAYGFEFYAGTGGSTSWYSNPELDALIKEMYVPENQEKLNSIVEKAARLVYDEHPVTLGYRNVIGYAHKNSITFTPTVNSQYIEAANIGAA